MEYEVKENARSRRVKLSVEIDGRVIVSVPSRKFLFLVPKFVADHEEWIELQRAKMQKIGPIVDLNGSAADFKKHKKIALEFLTKKVFEMNRLYNFRFTKISVRSSKGRWGSCSSDGALSFNYRLIKIPVELVEYVVAHEIAHLAEHNHGPRFWALVERAIPDYKKRRQALRKFIL
jgi:predicted metal-dependent hydrolase